MRALSVHGRHREIREHGTSDHQVPPIVLQEAPLKQQIKDQERENTGMRRGAGSPRGESSAKVNNKDIGQQPK